ncbi:hypothetical protein BV25DRAFT_1825897 [Artomyces pyxidatus]|uniref:Uncharacterized protein n=1 Tax=Artomyces pyxidatus TaxID=48021 RepID=A0ACB8SZY1_9AGAM|nr:hypothetical protein BV25DRAFT_1825897 [Artomyces pyxidatus]
MRVICIVVAWATEYRPDRAEESKEHEDQSLILGTAALTLLVLLGPLAAALDFALTLPFPFLAHFARTLAYTLAAACAFTLVHPRRLSPFFRGTPFLRVSNLLAYPLSGRR